MEFIGVTIRVGLLTTDDQISPTMETQQCIHISTVYHDEKVLQFSYNPDLGESWIKFVDDILYGSLILMKFIEWQYESVGLLTTVERMLSFIQQRIPNKQQYKHIFTLYHDEKILQFSHNPAGSCGLNSWMISNKMILFY